jgi:CheY-like chemotaxis protein
MKRRVLLLDDEKYVVDTMQKSMQRSGYDVQVSYNGQDGLYIAHSFHPHLIISDVAMPMMDGYMLYHELKGREETRTIPVIIMSAYAMREEEFRKLGVKDFLVKPFNMTMMMTVVEKQFALA